MILKNKSNKPKLVDKDKFEKIAKSKRNWAKVKSATAFIGANKNLFATKHSVA